MQIETHPLSRLACLALLLAASMKLLAAEYTLGADAWISEELMRQTLVIHQPPPAPEIRVRTPSALRVDLNADTAALCGRHLDRMWRMELQNRQLVRADIPQDYGVPRPQVTASRSGCATPATDTTIVILDKSGQTQTVQLKLPPGMEKFDWRSFSYDDARDLYLATGATSYALIPAEQAPESVSVTVAAGKISSGSIENTDFSSFECCARLGNDGKTLFSVANLGDENMSGFSGLVAIDVDTGRYRRMYLPFSPVWHRTGRQISRFDQPWFDLPGHAEAALWPRQEGRKLLLSGFSDSDAHVTEAAVLAIDIESGAVLATPNKKHESFEGLTRSGRHMLWRGERDETIVTDADSRELLHQHAGRVMAVAHAQRADAQTRLDDKEADGIRTYRSERPMALGLYAELPKIAAWLRRARSLEEFRLMLLSTDFPRPDPQTGRRTSVELGEVVVYAQGKPLPKAELPMPQWNIATQENDQTAWRDYAAACDAFAQAQDGESPLALLQCLAAPW